MNKNTQKTKAAQSAVQSAEEKQTVNVDIQSIIEENKQLKDTVTELKQMMQEVLKTSTPKETKSEAVNVADNSFDFEELPMVDPYKQIPITSFFNGGMTLRGNNKRIRLESFGMNRTVTFQDLQDIVNNHLPLAKEMAFFIHDREARKALYLEQYYKENITKGMIENFIMLDVAQMESVFKSLTKTLQETVIDFVIEGIKKGERHEYANRNKIELLERLSGKPILKIAKDQQVNDK